MEDESADADKTGWTYLTSAGLIDTSGCQLLAKRTGTPPGPHLTAIGASLRVRSLQTASDCPFARSVWLINQVGRSR